METLKLCDPAVGSGAFLLGAIQEMVALRRGILFSQRSYVEPHEFYQTVSDWKRRIIENSLYGVDNNPEAVEICRLRLWLSMVLDMDEPPAPNSDWALPNLDFQIVAGDSLVDRVAGIAFVGSWPPTDVTVGLELWQEIESLVSNIRSRRQEFDRVHRNPKRLRELRDIIARDQRKIVHLHLEGALKKAEADLEALSKSEKPTKTALRKARSLIDRIRSLLEGLGETDFALVQKPFLWPVAFPDVLRQGDPDAGFHIVLANPPYVRMEKLDNEDELSYGEAFPEVAASRADILVYFYARALQILRLGGWLSFITSNKFMRARYGEGIREHLPVSLRVRRVIDFGDLPLFEANGKAIAAYPAVLVGSRSDGIGEHSLKVADLAGPVRRALLGDNLKVNTESVRGVLEDLDGLLAKAEISDFPQVLLKSDRWVLEDPALIRLFERLMSHGTPLGEFVEGRIYRGVVTGLNEAFVIDEDKRRELIEEDRHSAELIKPWLRGRDIKRWDADSPGLYIIFANRGVDIDRYPAIEAHLRWFRSDLEKRATAHLHPWYELQQPQEGIYHLFAHSKIVWPDIAREMRFAYDSNGSYLANTAYAMPTDMKWLVPVMNSELVEFVLCHVANTLRGGYLRLIYEYVTQVPIVIPDRETEAELEARTKEILNLQASSEQIEAIEREVDSIVFHVYGLSAAERKLVLDWLGERREALGAEMPPDWRKLNALRATAGAWRDSIDGDQLIEDIYASRLIDTRPEPRL